MIGVMVCVIIVNFMLMVYCRRFKNKIIRAYAQDHDVTTNLIGLAAAVLAIRYYWWIDPTGAVMVSSYAALLLFFLSSSLLSFFLFFSFCYYYTFDNWVHLLFLFIQK